MYNVCVCMNIYTVITKSYTYKAKSSHSFSRAFVADSVRERVCAREGEEERLQHAADSVRESVCEGRRGTKNKKRTRFNLFQ
jgi:hypothetical protein